MQPSSLRLRPRHCHCRPQIGVAGPREQSRALGRRRGGRRRYMSGEWEYDPYEYAEELAAGQDLGRSDLADSRRTDDERGGMTRRERLARGGAGAAAVGGLGALAGPAAAATSEVDASGKF